MMTEPELQVVSTKPVLNYTMRTFKIIHFCSTTYLWIRQGGCWMWLHACCWEWHQARWHRWIFPAFRTGSSPFHFFLTPYSPLFFFFFWQDLLLPSIFVLCVFSQHCIHLFPMNLSQDKLTRSKPITAIMSQPLFSSTSPFQENS